MSHCSLADKQTLDSLVFTVIYQDKKTKVTYIKRCKLSGFIMNKPYELLPDPETCVMKKLSTYEDAEVTISYKGSRAKETVIHFSDFLIKGSKAGGVIVTKKEVASIRIKPCKLIVHSEEKLESSEEVEEVEVVAETQDKAEEKPKVKTSDVKEIPSLFDDVE